MNAASAASWRPCFDAAAAQTWLARLPQLLDAGAPQALRARAWLRLRQGQNDEQVLLEIFHLIQGWTGAALTAMATR